VTFLTAIDEQDQVPASYPVFRNPSPPISVSVLSDNLSGNEVPADQSQLPWLVGLDCVEDLQETRRLFGFATRCSCALWLTVGDTTTHWAVDPFSLKKEVEFFKAQVDFAITFTH
jgi:hypothetical protein